MNAQGWGLTDNVKERTRKGTNGQCDTYKQEVMSYVHNSISGLGWN